MKSFLVRWKTNGTVVPPETLVIGESFQEAIKAYFHFNCINAVMTYEEVKPYFLTLRVAELPYSFPITLYYVQHGNGKVFLRHYNAVLNNEVILEALKKVHKESHNCIGTLTKSFFNKVNNVYSCIEETV